MQRLLTFVVAVVGAFLVLALISCDGELPLAPDADLDRTELEAKANPAMHSVTGQATTWYVRPGINEGWLIISVNARLMPDGSPSGNFHWQYRSRDPGGRIFVKVSCMTIVGNEARIVGQASQAENPDNVGKWMGVLVRDHGQGQGADPDEISQRWFGTLQEAAMEFCAGPSAYDPVLREVSAGNIQIR